VNPLISLILILLVALMIYAIILGQNQPKVTVKALDKEKIDLRWATIEAMLDRGGLGLRSAVLEADKLLDYVMRAQGFRGNTMAERLKHAQVQIGNRNAVWNAHKLRNTLAHEMSADLVASQAKQAVADFKKALKDLGAL
jgi:hypothetical protein